MIGTWTVQYHFGFTNLAICGSDDMQYRSIFSYTICTRLKINGCVLKGVIY